MRNVWAQKLRRRLCGWRLSNGYAGNGQLFTFQLMGGGAELRRQSCQPSRMFCEFSKGWVCGAVGSGFGNLAGTMAAMHILASYLVALGLEYQLSFGTLSQLLLALQEQG